MNVKHLTPVVEHRKKFLQSLRPPCKTEMPLGSRYVPVVAVKDPDDLKETLYYVANMDMPSEQLEKVIEIYKRRWTV